MDGDLERCWCRPTLQKFSFTWKPFGLFKKMCMWCSSSRFLITSHAFFYSFYNKKIIYARSLFKIQWVHCKICQNYRCRQWWSIICSNFLSYHIIDVKWQRSSMEVGGGTIMEVVSLCGRGFSQCCIKSLDSMLLWVSSVVKGDVER